MNKKKTKKIIANDQRPFNDLGNFYAFKIMIVIMRQKTKISPKVKQIEF